MFDYLVFELCPLCDVPISQYCENISFYETQVSRCFPVLSSDNGNRSKFWEVAVFLEYLKMDRKSLALIFHSLWTGRPADLSGEAFGLVISLDNV